MQAWLLDGYSGINALRLAEVADPSPKPGEVVLAMRYAGLNPADAYLAQKLYPAKPTFPHILGREGLGTVLALGPGVTNWHIGDHALIMPSETGADRWGTFAHKVAVPAIELLPVPAEWDLKAAAAGPLVYLTAWQALTQWGPLPQDAIVLVTGASGGVGSAVLQLASAVGHQTVALTRSDAKVTALKSLGATFILNCTSKDWVKSLKEQLSGRRVHLAVDNIGGDLFPEIIDTLGMNGAVSVVGRLAGPVPQFNTATLFFRRLRIGGVAVSSWSPDQMRSEWRAIVDLLNRSGRRPIVDHIYPFPDLLKAFSRLAEGPIGKVMVEITPSA